jgi:drug/metabolite transporter (DMT)-like permease
VTAIWGYSFLLVHDAVAVYPVFLFLAVRFSIASLLLLPFLKGRLRHLDKGTLVGGFLMGTALFSGYAFQTLGLVWTSAAHSGFITGLFVVLTPLFEAVISRKFPRPAVATAVALATGGLVSLSWQGSLAQTNIGDLLSLVCAAVYAVHLLVTGHMARRYDTGALVIVQVATVAVLSWIFSVPSLDRIAPIPRPALIAILVTAVFATALAYYVQTAFQRFTSAVQTAIIFTMEPVFAGLAAVWVGGETLGWRGLFGGVLIVAGMLIGQVTESGGIPKRSHPRVADPPS